MYTVTTIYSSDDYKRPETTTKIVYSGDNARVAYAFAVKSWIERFEENYEYLPEDSSCISEFKELVSFDDGPLIAEEYYTNLHNFFVNNASEIWSPEYIYQPWFQLIVSKTESEKAPYEAIASMISSMLENFDEIGKENE